MRRKKSDYTIGTSGWNYKDWRGIFYPKDLPAKDWLSFYGKSFDIVEINATFYHLFPDEVFLRWKKLAKNNFSYIIKVSRYITHIKRLLHCKRAIKKFCRSAALLENKLSLVLLQLPPNMVYDLKRLEKAITAFNMRGKLVVEFRDEKWFTPEVKKLLIKKRCLFCAADSPKTRLISWVTANAGYIRLHGRKKWFDYKYTHRELKEVAKCAQQMRKNGAKKVYILFNNDYYAYAIQNARSLQSLLKK